MSLISSEIQQRIITAAEQLHAEHPERLPTVAEVRAVSKADMNSVSIVMKHWRQSKLMPVQKIEESAPVEILELSNQLASKIWSEAKQQADSKLRDAETKFNEERAETDEIRNQLKTMNRQFGFYMKHKTAMKNNFIGILDQTYPGVNTVVRQIKSTTIRHFILTGIAEKRSNKAYYKHLIRQIK